ncbi:MAG: hypothetical protein ACREIC_14850, partial [Limisphaerales bacterium]
YIDLNANGVIDAGDWLVQQFNLTDGQAGMVIGGVTNFNVPGDTDATAGQIIAKLLFRNGDFMQNTAGQYIFKVSSPTGRFAPIAGLFSVTNVPYPQKITGNVLVSGSSTALSNAVVLLFPPPAPGKNGPGGSPVAGTVVNNAGSYSVSVPPGTYVPVAFKNNYLANFASPPLVSLGAGATISTNLTLLNTTSTISGTLMDANNSSIGLPGVVLPVQSKNGLLAVTVTDTNGNFTVGVQSGQWEIKGDDTSLIVHGYLGLQNGALVSAGQTGVTVAVPKATALCYGSVKDTLGNPMPGLDVYINDNNNSQYQTDAYTDANGNYVGAVLGGLGANDPWSISISSDSNPANYVFSQPPFQQNGGANISAGTALQASFTAMLATNRVTGSLQAFGTNVPGVSVYAFATVNGTDFNTYTTTDNNGNYSLNVGNGSWVVGVNCSGDSDGLDNFLGSGNYQCPNNQTVNVNGSGAMANFVVQSCNGVQIFTTSLPSGQAGSYYNVSLQGSSCSGMLNWYLNDPQD